MQLQFFNVNMNSRELDVEQIIIFFIAESFNTLHLIMGTYP